MGMGMGMGMVGASRISSFYVVLRRSEGGRKWYLGLRTRLLVNERADEGGRQEGMAWHGMHDR